MSYSSIVLFASTVAFPFIQIGFVNVISPWAYNRFLVVISIVLSPTFPNLSFASTFIVYVLFDLKFSYV